MQGSQIIVWNVWLPLYFCGMENTIKVHDLTFCPFITADQIKDKVKDLGNQIAQDYQGKNPIFIGLLNGAFIFLADLVRASNVDSEIAFAKISSYSGTTSTGKIDLQLDLKVDIANRHIILVEDIIDTGRTMHYYLPHLNKQRPASIDIATLLVKPSAMEYQIDIKYIGFEIPDKFVIGYGLDYNELGRNLPAIYQLVQ